MFNILIIGLDTLSNKIIKYIKNTNNIIYGFDFDADKIHLFSKENLISNSYNTPLNTLLKEANAIILNTEFFQYENILESFPFAKSDSLIINTNIYKGNISKIQNLMKNRKNNFMPCNFLLFPQTTIINYNTDTKMNLILQTSNFFQQLKIKTSVLSPKENDTIFANLYQIPFLFETILFKNTKLHFINTNNTDYTSYNFFLEDILLNKINIVKNIEFFLSCMPQFKNLDEILNIIFNVETNNNKITETDINENIVLKIILEKIFISTFIRKSLEYYENLNIFNFDYSNYDLNLIKEYIINNHINIEILLTILKEKIINLTLLLKIEKLTVNKFLSYLKSY